MLTTINAKLTFLVLVAVVLIALSVSFSYLIAAESVTELMVSDVTAMADALEKNLNYIATVNPDAYKQDDFKKMIYAIRIGKNGTPFLVDELGTLVVHPTREGQNLAGQPFIDHIRNHKQGGMLEYSADSTGQQQIAAYRYIDTWNLWIVPGVTKADYFYQIKSAFLTWSLVFGAVIIAVLAGISFWIDRTVTTPLKGVLKIFAYTGVGDTPDPSQEVRETRGTVCRLLGNLLYSRHARPQR